MKVDINELRTLLMEVFSDSEIPSEVVNLRMNDLEEWDSIGNFSLLLAIEDRYKIKFDLNEMAELTSINSIALALENK
jgi:acyl carrier protein